MTNVSEILGQLRYTLDICNRLSMPGHSTLPCPDERQAVMNQLKANIEVLGKLAEVAHVEALMAHSLAAQKMWATDRGTV
ncbi:uncharacterized protein H6S33_004921 [Morchella sextelata]|uniref:uncharacterized protein n=1 Tax=Morchella sextelata TaxID=1174677 RepID=UPI001D040235|nr:uncharacterized protein H6S33_004921 [Morchella sextelata]KAH0604939.1 hypothetical protein H6S33_004921 [Morchella sextelata]